MSLFPWIAVNAVLLAALLAWARRTRGRGPATTVDVVAAETALAARPVFRTDERRVYRLLREALPHHVVLSRLPLARFCQPVEPAARAGWYELLGSSHVAFAVCSLNGRVIAAVDLDGDVAPARLTAHAKRAVLAACRVRYLRCAAHRMPSIAELQLLVPQPDEGARAPQPAPCDAMPRDTPRGHDGPGRRNARQALWPEPPLLTRGLRQSAIAPPCDRPAPPATRH